LGFETNVGRVYPASLSMNGYLLPRCVAVRDAPGAEQYTARARFKRRNHVIIRTGSLADIEIIALGDANDLVCGPRWRCSRHRFIGSVRSIGGGGGTGLTFGRRFDRRRARRSELRSRSLRGGRTR